MWRIHFSTPFIKATCARQKVWRLLRDKVSVSNQTVRGGFLAPPLHLNLHYLYFRKKNSWTALLPLSLHNSPRSIWYNYFTGLIPTWKDQGGWWESVSLIFSVLKNHQASPASGETHSNEGEQLLGQLSTVQTSSKATVCSVFSAWCRVTWGKVSRPSLSPYIPGTQL